MPEGQGPEAWRIDLSNRSTDRIEPRPARWPRTDDYGACATGTGAYSQFANSLVETSREPFLVLDRNLIIKMANPAFSTAFDQTDGETIGTGFFDLDALYGEGRELRGLLARVLADGEGFADYEMSRDFPRVGYRSFLLTAQPLQFGGIVRPFILLAFQDVTQQRLAERALQEALARAEEASRTKSQFLATMSHELRTPLNAILGFSEIIKQQYMGPIGAPIYAEYAADIYESGSHLLALVDDLLDLARLEAGKREIADEPVSIAEVVDVVLRTVAPMAENAGITVSETISDGLPVLRGDRRAVRQMLTNLLSNAIKYTLAGGRAWVTAKDAPGGLVLEVGDTGVGMSADEMEVALRPFGRLKLRGMEQQNGTGLGLPIVKSLIELHGGVMELESSPGQGTRVRLVFPHERIS